MKTFIFMFAASVFLFTGCRKEEEDVIPEKPAQILVKHNWKLIEITEKRGTLDPFAEVPPDKITVITEGCKFGVIVDFLEPNTYKGYGEGCMWGSGDGRTWEILDNVLRLRAPGMGLAYVIRVLNNAEMLLSTAGDPVDCCGEQTATIYRFQAQ